MAGGPHTTTTTPLVEVVREYEAELGELTFNSKPIINNLTIIAGECIHIAEPIAHVVENRIRRAPVDQKLPAMYLLDSIVKNIGDRYKDIFARSIVNIFCSTYEALGNQGRMSLLHLLRTWNDVFPPPALAAINDRLQAFNRTEEGWGQQVPTTQGREIHINPAVGPGASARSIHVNPRYFETHRQRIREAQERAQQGLMRGRELQQRIAQTTLPMQPQVAARTAQEELADLLRGYQQAQQRKQKQQLHEAEQQQTIAAITTLLAQLQNKVPTALLAQLAAAFPQLVPQMQQSAQPASSPVSSHLIPLPAPVPLQLVPVSAAPAPAPAPALDATSQLQNDLSALVSRLQNQLAQPQVYPNATSSAISVLEELQRVYRDRAHPQVMAEMSALLAQLRGGVMPHAVPVGSTGADTHRVAAPYHNLVATLGQLQDQQRAQQQNGISGPLQANTSHLIPVMPFPVVSSSESHSTGGGGGGGVLRGKRRNSPVSDSTRANNARRQRIPKSLSKPETLRLRDDAILDSLHKSLAFQCSTCARRFSTKEEMDAHLDWHFEQNRQRKGRIRRPASRTYFLTLESWIFGQKHAQEDAVSSFFANSTAEAEAADAALREKTLSGAVELPSVPVGETDEVCAACEETFKLFWHEGSEEWRYQEAIKREDGRIVHVKCCETTAAPSGYLPLQEVKGEKRESS